MSRAPKVGTVVEYHPVMFDTFYDHSVRVEPGTKVQIVQPHGTPRNGTMGQAFIATLDGEFIGLRCLGSLRRAS